jgi:hypothetical protein
MAKKHTRPLRFTDATKGGASLRDRFGKFERAERRELRIAVHDGASIGEILLLLMVGFVHLDIVQVERFLGLTHARAKDLLNSVRRRLENYSSARDHEARNRNLRRQRTPRSQRKIVRLISQEKS